MEKISCPWKSIFPEKYILSDTYLFQGLCGEGTKKTANLDVKADFLKFGETCHSFLHKKK